MNFSAITDYSDNSTYTEAIMYCGDNKVGECSFKTYTLHSEKEFEILRDSVVNISEDESLALSGMFLTPRFKNNCFFPVNILYISTFYIYPEFREKGFGTVMLEYIRKQSRELLRTDKLFEAVYIFPFHTQKSSTGDTKHISNAEYHKITVYLKRIFENAGYVNLKDPYHRFQKCYMCIGGI